MFMIILRTIADTLFYMLTIPFRILLLFVILISVIVNQIRYGGDFAVTVLKYVQDEVEMVIRQEVNWIKTGTI